MYLWDKEYGTNYIKLDDYPQETRTMMTYGVYNSTEITVEQLFFNPIWFINF